MLPNLIVVLYALLPITLLTSHSLPSAIFYGLVAASLILLAQKRFAGAAAQTYQYRWVIASYSVLFLAVAASSLYHGKWAGANSEGALRFFLGLWVLLLALPHIPQERLKHAVWGIYVAGLVSTATLIWLIVNVDARPSTPGRILTTYTAIMLLLGGMSLYSIKWTLTAWPRVENALKIAVAAATFVGFLLAQTRTGLLGLPLFIVLGLILFVGLKKPGRFVAGLALIFALAAGLVANTDALRGRLQEGVQEVQACQDQGSTHYSSMCIRLQMWRSAVDAGVNNPWFGLGEGGKFNQYMQDVGVPKGLVSQRVVDEGFGEPHNDILLMFVAFGFPGALGLILIYLVPCFYFVPRLFSKDSSPGIRAAAAMGLAVCLGFALFGLTDTLFRRMNTMSYYAAMVAWLMVLSQPRALARGNA